MRGEYVAPSLCRVTIGELGSAWLARQQGHMKPSGFWSYESAWRVHIKPRWAGLRVADVRFSDVQEVLRHSSVGVGAGRQTRPGHRADRPLGAHANPR